MDRIASKLPRVNAAANLCGAMTMNGRKVNDIAMSKIPVEKTIANRAIR